MGSQQAERQAGTRLRAGAPAEHLSGCLARTMALPCSVPNALPVLPPPNMAAGAEDEWPGLRSELERRGGPAASFDHCNQLRDPLSADYRPEAPQYSVPLWNSTSRWTLRLMIVGLAAPQPQTLVYSSCKRSTRPNRSLACQSTLPQGSPCLQVH